MATKTIITLFTLHAPCPDKFVPNEYDNNGGVLKGKYAVVEHGPGSRVTIDEEEADDLIARKLTIESDTPAPLPEPASDTGKPAGKGAKAS